MKQPWSISTTVRNPERIRDFLKVVKKLEWQVWNIENQIKFQTLLIQNRLYWFWNTQFYNWLTQEQVKLVDNIDKEISFEQAKEIFEIKNYEDPAMRWRQSLNPIKKLWFVYIKDNILYFSDLWSLFIQENYDIWEIFFRCFVKLQFSNLWTSDFSVKDWFNIKPFIWTLHLINQVNLKWEKLWNKPVWIKKSEFCLFALTLINYTDIEKTADKIINLRNKLKLKTKKEQKEIFETFEFAYVKEFLWIEDKTKIQKAIKNLWDYWDNAIRYFRLTRFIHIRWGWFHVDLEQRRSLEIQELLNKYNWSVDDFSSKDEYFEYLADINKPVLPWEEPTKLNWIIKNLFIEIKELEISLNIEEIKQKELSKLSSKELQRYIEELREYRTKLQNKINYKESQSLEKVEEYIKTLKNIYDLDNRPLELEKYATFSLEALNDALQIKPNYPVWDDNEPINTAPGWKPDIECYYQSYNAICEVTMLKDRSQWYNEWQPIMRHLRDFETIFNKDSYCLFIAPKIHQDTLNTFWFSVKYEYQGKKQKIVPISINQFVEILEVLHHFKSNWKKFSHEYLKNLYDNILEVDSFSNSLDWETNIPNKIKSWKENILSN